MKIQYSQNAEDIRPLAERWVASCRADEFGLAVDLETAMADLDLWLTTSSGTIILAREEDDTLIGFLAIVEVPSNIGENVLALEKYWYADENRALVGPKLFCAARDWARKQGCSHFVLATSNVSSHHYDSVVRFCRNLGMKEFETTYITPLN